MRQWLQYNCKMTEVKTEKKGDKLCYCYFSQQNKFLWVLRSYDGMFYFFILLHFIDQTIK